MTCAANYPKCKSEGSVVEIKDTNVSGTMTAGFWCLNCDSKRLTCGKKPEKVVKNCVNVE
ncbi:MAG: hypothetical protein KGD63_03750 [Candidatus Lokiarchaeota archaeon]|nr:hypothetical protein [Candidatus Lokiarchaeota archaeon]